MDRYERDPLGMRNGLKAHGEKESFLSGAKWKEGIEVKGKKRIERQLRNDRK